MKTRILFIALVLSAISMLSAQEGIKKFVYKGNVGKFPVTMYLIEETTGCGPKIYSGMYQYDKLSKWLFLKIEDDEQNRLIMVEGLITGILSLKKSGEALTGYWISPDGSKKLDVRLKEIPATIKTLETYDRTYETVNYEMHDC